VMQLISSDTRATIFLASYYTDMENHVNAFQQIREKICVNYEFLQRNHETLYKTNLGICCTALI